MKDNYDNFKDFLIEKLGYNLIFHEDFVKLEKIPGRAEGWMGIEGFTDIKEYIFFVILLMYLEDKNKEEQFVLSFVTEYISNQYQNEKIDWTKYSNRKSLVKVIKLALKLGIMKNNDGDEDEFSSNENADVLYESTGISRYIVRSFSKDIMECESLEELMHHNFEGVEQDKGMLRRNRVYRRLLLSPVVYNGGTEDSDYDYIKKFRSSLQENFENNLGWDLHVHKNGALIVLSDDNKIGDLFPSMKGESEAILLFGKLIREKLEEGKLVLNLNDEIVLSRENFNELLLELRNKKGSGFKKELRDSKDEYFIDVLLNYMKDFLMVEEREASIVILPVLGKVVGDYPKDYLAEEN
ncbi:TIGR02678 family protein [Clostridium carboxidivorans]|uniref:TIGR02678 family protein n=1 Tax=Clostridium carboxidivorans TaxID=217159 RepID=UPI0009D6B9CF|nr:TIGR02678 family protein [Clostridium carboxidivorans]